MECVCVCVRSVCGGVCMEYMCGVCVMYMGSVCVVHVVCVGCVRCVCGMSSVLGWGMYMWVCVCVMCV